MLPKSHKKAYEYFLVALQKLQDQLTATNLDINSIHDNLELVTKIFQEEIINLTDDELELAITSRWRSLQTEIHRSIRLLTTDLMFLKSSVTQATATARRSSFSDRLDKIIYYCQLLLND